MADNTSIKDASNTTVTIATDDVNGAQVQRVKPVHGADGVATDVTSTTPFPSGNYVQNSSGTWVPAGFATGGGPIPATITHPLSQPLGVAASVTAYGYLRVATEPSSMFTDSFETLDTTTRWTTGGTVIPTVATGRASIAPSTTISATSALISQPTFPPVGLNFVAMGWIANFENTSASAGGLMTTNNHRFMGLGTVPVTWTSAYTASSSSGPLLDAIGFEVDTDGKLYPVVYSNGTRVRPSLTLGGTDINTGNGTGSQGGLRTLANGSTHSFTIVFRTDIVLWFVDGIEWPLAVMKYSDATFTIPAVQNLPIRFHSINSTSSPGTAPVLGVAALALGDTGNNNAQISDPSFPFRKAQVGKFGGLSVKGASITPVSTGFGAGTTGNTASVDVSEAGNVTFTVKNTVAATAFTGTPIIVFEQSDDNVSWGALQTVRADTGVVASTQVLVGANAASTGIVFDGACEGINYVRARVTTGTTANGMTINIVPGGMPFSPAVALLNPVRSAWHLTALGVTAGTTATEALVTFTSQKGVAATTSATSFAITNGRTLRIQSINIGMVGNATATIASITYSFRFNTAGAISTTSTASWRHRLGSPATAGNGYNEQFDFTDGYDIVGTSALQFGMTVNPVFVTNAPTYDITISGYEF